MQSALIVNPYLSFTCFLFFLLFFLQFPVLDYIYDHRNKKG